MLQACFKLARTSWVQLLCAALAGALFGLIWPQEALMAKALADAFIRAIGWLVPVILFVLVTSGVAGLGGRTGSRRLALHTACYFQSMCVLALLFGVGITWCLQPGLASSLPVEEGAHGATLLQRAADVRDAAGSGSSMAATFTSLMGALLNSRILQVLMLALIAGWTLTRLGERATACRAVLEEAQRWSLRMLSWLLRLAPIAAFGAVAYTVARYGAGAAIPLLKFLLVMYVGCLAFIGVAMAGVARLCGVSLYRLIVYVKEELTLVAATGSSVAALPSLIVKLEKLGCAREVVRVVLTTGYTFNLAGSSLYLGAALMFLLQLQHVSLDAGQVGVMLIVTLLMSLGTTSVAGSSFFTLAATISVLQAVPVESMGILLGVERLLKCRSLTNVLGNCLACLAIARWQRALDERALRGGQVLR
ncbi:cation:dicarboxylate symporter family transporter [Pseudomonas matsuisoli]|uniref:C4-dicarboxylate transport protein n=1 Tax=Pseudomonas matsuisoli TaxID=1515666 RepID=A0A917PXR6_9PSED|nr:cation:dicarboxylase symporter family transporter [Pseudomonas matsuisoli]GGJ98024.1 C4-dicarboxylate transport protein [Pseudomonas matsuisoli]